MTIDLRAEGVREELGLGLAIQWKIWCQVLQSNISRCVVGLLDGSSFVSRISSFADDRVFWLAGPNEGVGSLFLTPPRELGGNNGVGSLFLTPPTPMRGPGVSRQSVLAMRLSPEN